MNIFGIFRASGLTDAQIAEEMGVSPSTVWRWRHSKFEVGLYDVVQLSKLLGCTPAELRPDLAALFSVKL